MFLNIVNINFLVFQIKLGGIAHNVLGNWRFTSPNKGLRSKTRAGKMWWSKIPQRAKPDCDFAEP